MGPGTLTLVAGCLGATLVVFPAITVFLGNVLEFPFSLAQALPYLIGLGAALAAVTLLGLRLVPWHEHAVALVLGLTVAAWIQANLLTWDYGVLDGTAIPWDRYAWRGLVDLGLWLVVPGFFLLGRRAVGRHAARVAWGLLAVQLAGSLLAAASAETQPSYLRNDVDQDLRFRLSARRNVILLVLDGVQASEWSRALLEEPSLARAFDGFTYFRDAVADFPITQASIPALLTAEHYDGSRPYAAFVEQAYLSEASLPRALKRAGFLVDLYGLRRAIRSDASVVSNIRPARSSPRRLAAPLASLVDTALFRSAPQPLKRVVYADQAWCLGRVVRRLGLDGRTGTPVAVEIADNVGFVEAFERAVPGSAREAAPAFKLYHLIGPHPPLRVNERGERESLSFSPENYRRTLRGVTRLVGTLFDTLRQEGLYDEALLLVVSDHGLDLPVVPPRDRPVPGGDAPSEFPRALALVLVKPVASHGPLRVCDAPVQLSDVPKTVLAQLGIEHSALPGADMFALAQDAARVRTFRAMLDTNWKRSRHLSAMTEYAVSGPAWLRSSWTATGRVFGSYAEALRVFRRLEHNPLLGELTAATNDGALPGLVVTNDGQLQLYFPTPDPAPGAYASVTLPLEGLALGQRYRLAVDVVDACALLRPGRFLQRLWLDDRLLYSHDLAGDDFRGSRRVEWSFEASSRRATLRAEVRAVGSPEKGFSWGTIASLGLRRLAIEPQAP